MPGQHYTAEQRNHDEFFMEVNQYQYVMAYDIVICLNIDVISNQKFKIY